MTFAWAGHVKSTIGKPWLVAALVCWSKTSFEYLLQVPAKRIGYSGGCTLAQLKVAQEVITLLVFVPFALFCMQQLLAWDHLWAALCLVGAVYSTFRS